MNTEEHLKLLGATALGDQKAFESLYQLTSGTLYAVSLNILQCKSLAEDALQEAFISIWHKASEYRQERGTVLTWMTSIVRYRALDMIRTKKKRKESDNKVPQLVVEPSQDSTDEINLFQSRDRIKLDDCMDRLKQPQAHAISLAYFRGFTHSEVCKHMTSPLGSVKSWIRRGLESLRRCIES